MSSVLLCNPAWLQYISVHRFIDSFTAKAGRGGQGGAVGIYLCVKGTCNTGAETDVQGESLHLCVNFSVRCKEPLFLQIPGGPQSLERFFGIGIKKSLTLVLHLRFSTTFYIFCS